MKELPPPTRSEKPSLRMPKRRTSLWCTTALSKLLCDFPNPIGYFPLPHLFRKLRRYFPSSGFSRVAHPPRSAHRGAGGDAVGDRLGRRRRTLESRWRRGEGCSSPAPGPPGAGIGIRACVPTRETTASPPSTERPSRSPGGGFGTSGRTRPSARSTRSPARPSCAAPRRGLPGATRRCARAGA